MPTRIYSTGKSWVLSSEIKSFHFSHPFRRRAVRHCRGLKRWMRPFICIKKKNVIRFYSPAITALHFYTFCDIMAVVKRRKYRRYDGVAYGCMAYLAKRWKWDDIMNSLNAPIRLLSYFKGREERLSAESSCCLFSTNKLILSCTWACISNGAIINMLTWCTEKSLKFAFCWRSKALEKERIKLDNSNAWGAFLCYITSRYFTS